MRRARKVCPGKTGLAFDGHGVRRVRCELEQAAMSNGKIVDMVKGVTRQYGIKRPRIACIHYLR